MARSHWLAPLAILLVVVMFMTGCVSAAPRSFEGTGGAGVAVAHSNDANGGAHKTHGGEALAALFILGGIVIVGAVIADLIILPCTAPCHRSFCCTHEVVYVFYR